MDTREKLSEKQKERWRRREHVDVRVDALAAHVKKVVDTLPPLTAEQRDRLRAALAPALDRGVATP